MRLTRRELDSRDPSVGADGPSDACGAETDTPVRRRVDERPGAAVIVGCGGAAGSYRNEPGMAGPRVCGAEHRPGEGKPAARSPGAAAVLGDRDLVLKRVRASDVPA